MRGQVSGQTHLWTLSCTAPLPHTQDAEPQSAPPWTRHRTECERPPQRAGVTREKPGHLGSDEAPGFRVCLPVSSAEWGQQSPCLPEVLEQNKQISLAAWNSTGHTCHCHHATWRYYAKRYCVVTHLGKLGARPHTSHAFLTRPAATVTGHFCTSQSYMCPRTCPKRLLTPRVSFSGETVWPREASGHIAGQWWWCPEAPPSLCCLRAEPLACRWQEGMFRGHCCGVF